MQVYRDITLLPGDDIGHHFLWEKVFCQVHLALVENKNAEGRSPFGITFPEFDTENNRLGHKLRVFAPDQVTMEKLTLSRWLENLLDYVHLTSIRPVPETGGATVRTSRMQTKSNAERLIRRAAHRQNISLEEARVQRRNTKSQFTRAPYIWVKSLSSGERFRLFIKQEMEERVQGSVFTLYGFAIGEMEGSLPYF